MNPKLQMLRHPRRSLAFNNYRIAPLPLDCDRSTPHASMHRHSIDANDIITWHRQSVKVSGDHYITG